jgi:hypothetical protein
VATYPRRRPAVSTRGVDKAALRELKRGTSQASSGHHSGASSDHVLNILSVLREPAHRSCLRLLLEVALQRCAVHPQHSSDLHDWRAAPFSAGAKPMMASGITEIQSK